MCFLAVLFCTLCVFHSTTAFCERKYKNPYWIPKSLSQRAAEADIVIYGNVTESPCMKPISVNPKQIFPAACIANATNSSTVFNSSVQQSTPNLNITEGNITDICLTCALYNVSLQVHCVIKGGSVPGMVHLRGLGFGPGMCTYGTYIYNYMETVLTFQMYKDRNYVIFLGRNKGSIDSDGFWPHHVNMQFAAAEIMNENQLQSIFAAAGGHAHSPTGILPNETHSICTPYTAGAGNNHQSLLFALVVLLCRMTLM